VAGRAYGLGTYGTGRYGVGAGANFEVAAQASITLAPAAEPSMVYAVGAATSITLQPQGFAARIWSPITSTRIRFRVKTRAYVVHEVTGATQISFSVQGELVKTWQDPGPCFVPCETGTWTQEFPPWVVRELA